MRLKQAGSYHLAAPERLQLDHVLQQQYMLPCDYRWSRVVLQLSIAVNLPALCEKDAKPHRINEVTAA